jgi:small subunit ribosomal protein S17
MANNRKRLVGRVVSNKMDKTVVVAIERRKLHRVYKKIIITTKKVMAHDESNTVPEGAIVRIVESKPYSKNKRWVVETVLESPEGAIVNVSRAVNEIAGAGTTTSAPAQPEIEPAAVVETEAEAETQAETEAEAEVRTEVEAEAEPTAVVETQTQAETDVEAEVRTEVEASES